VTARTPRPYQDRAHDELRRHVAAGKRRILLVSPTGSGKTFMLSRVCAGAVAKGKRVAWFAHRRELVRQAAESLTDFGIDVGHSGKGLAAPVQVVGVQAALSRGEAPPADIVVLDEAHHFAADEWGQLPKAYPDALIIGASATPERADGRGLDCLFEDLIVVAQPEELAREGHLVPCETIRPPRPQPAGKIAWPPVEAYLEHTSGRLAVVFAPHVKAAHEFADGFRKHHVPVGVVDGEMPTEERDRVLAEFAARRLLVLVNVYVLTEGWDCPEVDVVILARKFGSRGAFMQAAGRGLRTAKGKSVCTILDLAGVTHIHGDPLEECEFSLDGEPIRRKGTVSLRLCRVCGEPLDDFGSPCARCGIAQRVLEVPGITRDPMAKFARIQRDPDDARAARLARWINEAKGKGWRWQSACHRYRGTYGSPPPSHIVSQALSISLGRPWCPACRTSKCGHVAKSA